MRNFSISKYDYSRVLSFFCFFFFFLLFFFLVTVLELADTGLDVVMIVLALIDIFDFGLTIDLTNEL